MEKLFEIWHRSARQRLRRRSKTEVCGFCLRQREVTLTHVPSNIPSFPPTHTFCGISLSISHNTHSAPPWPCGNMVSCLKSGESSWEGWARYVQQTVEPGRSMRRIVSLYKSLSDTSAWPSAPTHTHLHSHTRHWTVLTVTAGHIKWRAKDWICQCVYRWLNIWNTGRWGSGKHMFEWFWFYSDYIQLYTNSKNCFQSAFIHSILVFVEPKRKPQESPNSIEEDWKCATTDSKSGLFYYIYYF